MVGPGGSGAAVSSPYIAEAAAQTGPELDVLLILLAVVAVSALVVGAVCRLLFPLVRRFGPVDEGATLSLGEATTTGFAPVLGYLLVYWGDGAESQIVLGLAVATVVGWGLLKQSARLFGWERFDGSGFDLASRHVLKLEAVVVAAVVLYFAWHIPALMAVVVFMTATMVVGFLLTGGSSVLRRYGPSPGGGALPSHYGGALQQSGSQPSRTCPECETENEPGATVCAECTTRLSSARRPNRPENPNAHLRD